MAFTIGEMGWNAHGDGGFRGEKMDKPWDVPKHYYTTWHGSDRGSYRTRGLSFSFHVDRTTRVRMYYWVIQWVNSYYWVIQGRTVYPRKVSTMSHLAGLSSRLLLWTPYLRWNSPTLSNQVAVEVVRYWVLLQCVLRNSIGYIIYIIHRRNHMGDGYLEGRTGNEARGYDRLSNKWNNELLTFLYYTIEKPRFQWKNSPSTLKITLLHG